MVWVKKAWNFIRDLLGFRINSHYIKNYINDANIKSSIYMSFIVVVLEIWMIFRQLFEYVIPGWKENVGVKMSAFEFLFKYYSYYTLFIVTGIAVFLFAVFYFRNKHYKKSEFIINLVTGSICISWFFIVFLEKLKGQTAIYVSSTYILYALMPILGVSIIANAIYKKLRNQNHSTFAMAVIISFAAICLTFGVKFGYIDFISTSRPKMIICFLTMILFVACLLIWKPYISIIILTSIFVLFAVMLKNVENTEASKRVFLDGDLINYITFLISLTMVTISIYQQRITEAKKDEKLIHDAIFDPLVEANNLQYAVDRINSKFESGMNYYYGRICLFINIANFKMINNQRGFAEGNKFLKDLVHFIKLSFPDDLIARQSDDHFVVFTSQNGFMDRINTLNEHVKDLADGLFVLLKVGGYKPHGKEEPYIAVDKARYACSRIKNKSDVIFNEYDEQMDEKLEKSHYIVNHLDEAIEKGWVKAYYQPVVWSNDKELCGAEALARWIDPVYGFLSPADFIPLLEETRLIHKLDKAIIEYVCREMRRAIDENRTVVPVSINFSRLDFELMDVIEVLETSVSKYNIDKNYIHVEITESALSDNTLLLSNTVSKLRENGYSIWLDDFGSGYSSLNILKDFKFDVIKIDMKFLSNFESNEKTKDILDCIITLAERLGMNTLTEGVETEDESNYLREIGCGRLQGYLFGKPLRLSEFEDRIYNKELIVSKNIL